MHALTTKLLPSTACASAERTLLSPTCFHPLRRYVVKLLRHCAMAWARATAASLSRLFAGSDASSSSTPQNRVIACAAPLASCSAGDKDVVDGVGVVAALVAEVVVE